MKKMLVLLLITALVMGVVALAGCGEKKVTIEGEDGEVDITEKDGEVSVTDEEGDSFSTKEISAEDLDIPVYPGAKVQDGTAAEITSEGVDGTESGSIAVLETKDSVSDVIAWYKDKLSGKDGFTDSSMAIEGQEVGMFYYQDGTEIKSVIVGQNDETGATEIVLSSGSAEGMTIPETTE